MSSESTRGRLTVYILVQQGMHLCLDSMVTSSCKMRNKTDGLGILLKGIVQEARSSLTSSSCSFSKSALSKDIQQLTVYACCGKPSVPKNHPTLCLVTARSFINNHLSRGVAVKATAKPSGCPH